LTKERACCSFRSSQDKAARLNVPLGFGFFPGIIRRAALFLLEARFFRILPTGKAFVLLVGMKEFLRDGGWIASIFCFLFMGVVCAEPEFYTPDRDKFDPEKDKIEDKAGLPQVLLIGNSIMGGYYKQVAKELEKEANVHRHPGNAGDTVNGLRYIDEWLGETKWGVIHFNWGLHDLCYRHPESKEQGKRDKERGKISVPLEDYSKNLEQLVIRL
jgi:hypothetical protein